MGRLRSVLAVAVTLAAVALVAFLLTRPGDPPLASGRDGQVDEPQRTGLVGRASDQPAGVPVLPAPPLPLQGFITDRDGKPVGAHVWIVAKDRSVPDPEE